MEEGSILNTAGAAFFSSLERMSSVPAALTMRQLSFTTESRPTENRIWFERAPDWIIPPLMRQVKAIPESSGTRAVSPESLSFTRFGAIMGPLGAGMTETSAMDAFDGSEMEAT